MKIKKKVGKAHKQDKQMKKKWSTKKTKANTKRKTLNPI